MNPITSSDQTLDLSSFDPTLKNQIEHYQSRGVHFIEEDHGDYIVIIAWNIHSGPEGTKRPHVICWKGCLTPQHGYQQALDYLKDHRTEWER